VKTIGPITFIHVKHDNVFLIAVTKRNVSVSLVFEVLNRIIEIFKCYIGKFNEEETKGNAVLLLELLDEFLDYGYPQNLTLETVKPFITQKSVNIKPEKLKEEKLAKITINATGTTPWRPLDLKYKKNEIYIDIIESVNILVSVDGKILRSDVSGQVQMRCFLSGVPDCKFGLNDKILMDKEARTGVKSKSTAIEIDDCKFHQCVKLGKF